MVDSQNIGGNFVPKHNQAPPPVQQAAAAHKATSEQQNKAKNLKLNAQQLVKQLTSALGKANDPQIQAFIAKYTVNSNNKQSMALALLACIKGMFKKSLSLSKEEEEAIVDYLLEQYEEDSTQPVDPDEQKKKKERSQQKKTQNKSDKSSLVITIIDETMGRLNKDSDSPGLNIRS